MRKDSLPNSPSEQETEVFLFFVYMQFLQKIIDRGDFAQDRLKSLIPTKRDFTT